ncbi:unnamed protein product [Oncorhynchus mykiss]|uniref:LIM zinc-binding domain-containing protein n=1 Tax=Oncorhynchus mykiss TaxID=8022 RepID=A0A060YNG3_ONCMY|nr:unnamed protein product [Oncorhynchus mykiss]
MVSMKVPDRLSIITYVSQYYNFFTNKSHANPPCLKRSSGTGHIEPAQKRPVAPLEDKVVEPELSLPGPMGTDGGVQAGVKRSTLSSSCAACQRHVHLVQRFLVDGKLYHRNCFRCRECSSTLLPGSYKLGNEVGSLVCTHHFARSALANQNGRPDLSKRPTMVPSVRIENEREDGAGEREVKPPPSVPPNPFDDIEEEGEETPTTAKVTAKGVIPSTPVSHLGLGDSKPVPIPRRLSQPSPPPRPAPRVRPPCVDTLAVNGDRGEHRRSLPPAPRPRERSHSPGSSSLSSDAPKPPNPPWLALVQSQEPKKKPAPPPPPGVATPPHTGSLSSLKGEGSRPPTPPAPANPFDEEEEEVGSGQGSVGSLVSPTVVVSHPWYSISQADPDTPPIGGISSRSASPNGFRCKKRPAPPKPVPKAPGSNSALPHSQPSSSSPSPAISIESLSSASDHSSSHPASLGGGATGDQDNPFTKSVSEPSICGPCGGFTPTPSTSANRLSPSPSPPPQPANPRSAPATPQSNRSARPPPPRPPTTPSPLAASSAIPVPPPKRTCKENPFNRKASPSPKTRPPRGPRPARPPAPGHGFPLIKRKVQSDQYIPAEDIHGEMGELEKQLDELEQRGVALERKLRDNPNDEEEETLLVDWFTLIHEKHLLVRREAELVYTAKQQNLEERQADVEYELRCLLNKPEKDWNEEDKGREQELMTELVTVIEQRNQIINNMDQDRQREEEEDKLVATMLKRKDFQKEPAAEGEQQQQQKKKKKFKPMKVLKRLSVNQGKGGSPRKEMAEKDKS